jgi:hypothetical protein
MKRGPKPKMDRSAVRSNDDGTTVSVRLSRAEKVRLDRILALRGDGAPMKVSEFFREWITKQGERLGVPA